MRGRKINEILKAGGNDVFPHRVFLLPQSEEKNGEMMMKTHETLVSIYSSNPVLTKTRTYKAATAAAIVI